MSGIVSDVQRLIQQQVQLTRAEIKMDFGRLKEAAALLVPGVGVFTVSLISFALMLAHLLHTLTSPAGTDPASFPLWACFGVVGVLLAIAGGALVFAGKKKFDSVNPMTGPTAQALEEDVQWMSNPK
jgi:heme A synthase